LMGRREEALEAVARLRILNSNNLFGQSFGAMSLSRLGLEDEAREIYEKLLIKSEKTFITPGLLAVLAASFGDNDEAFRHLETGLRTRSLILSWLRDPLLDEFRADPRFSELMDQVGLEP